MSKPKTSAKETSATTKRRTKSAQNGPDKDAASGPAPVRLRVAHEMRGRTRFRLAGRGDRARLQELVDAAASCAGVRRVVGRPNTGSLIVEHEGASAALLAQLEARGLARPAPPAPTIPVEQAARLGLARVDAEIAHRTDGAFGFRSALAAALFLGAIIQASRGQVAGPATTLALSALTLLEQQRR